MAHKVFICHSSKDKAVADAACAALESHRIPCWIAPRDITPGDEYAASIIDALDECQIVLLIFSTHSNNSTQCRREIERAVSKEKILVPFRIEDVLPTRAMEFHLMNTHWLDALTPPREQRLADLCTTITRILQRHPPAPPLWGAARTDLETEAAQEARQQAEAEQRKQAELAQELAAQQARAAEEQRIRLEAEQRARELSESEAQARQKAEAEARARQIAEQNAREALAQQAKEREERQARLAEEKRLSDLAEQKARADAKARQEQLSAQKARDVERQASDIQEKPRPEGIPNRNEIPAAPTQSNLPKGRKVTVHGARGSQEFPQGIWGVLVCGLLILVVVLILNSRKQRSQSATEPAGGPNALADQIRLTHFAILQGHTSEVSSIAVSPDGGTLASASPDHTVRFWNLADGSLKQTFDLSTRIKFENQIVSMAYAHDGHTLALGTHFGIKIMDLSKGEVLRTFGRDETEGLSVAISPNDSYLATGGFDEGRLSLYEYAAGNLLFQSSGTSEYTQVNSVAFNTDGSLLAAAVGEEPRGVIKLVQVPSGRDLSQLQGVAPVAFSPDGRVFVYSQNDDSLALADPSTKTIFCRLVGHTDSIETVAFSPDGRILASGGEDKTLKIWDIPGCRLIDSYQGSGYVHSVSFSPDGLVLASAVDNDIWLWKLR